MAQMIVIDSSCIMYAYSPSLTMITILCEPTGGEYHRACRGDPRPKAAMAMSGSAVRFVCSLRCIKAFINADFAEIGHDSMLPSSIPCIIILVFSHFASPRARSLWIGAFCFAGILTHPMKPANICSHPFYHENCHRYWACTMEILGTVMVHFGHSHDPVGCKVPCMLDLSFIV